ncbi:hypothetical protein B0O99DRAFT_618434 [Bisporella sp. PMI_857]|nr:hypothetical protein B0O99DRAFT_618434 [Bisporella sp. PMI_857]
MPLLQYSISLHLLNPRHQRAGPPGEPLLAGALEHNKMANPSETQNKLTWDTKRPNASRSTQKLSEERLARKRALDREAQRSSRCKTKNHIALLESRIEALTRARDNGTTKELIDQIEQQRLENEALKARLKSIAKLVSGSSDGLLEETSKACDKGLAPSSERQKGDLDTSAHEQINQLQPTGFLEPDNLHIDDGYSHDSSSTPGQPYQFLETLQTPIGGSNDVSSLFGVPPTNAPATDMYNVDPCSQQPSLPLMDEQLWGLRDLCSGVTQCKCSKIKNFTSELLSQCARLQLQNKANQPARDVDILIRAVLHGWHTVTRKYLLDPLWAMLRHADEMIFSKCEAIERLLVLRNLALMLRYRVNPTQQNFDALPYYLHERPSQRLIPHEAVIDYVAWPGLRERFIFAPHRYCNEKFTALFWKCFRFAWPYELHEAYTRNPENGQYMLSKMFDEQSRSLHNLRMTSEFLDEFPELRADITMAEDEKVDDRKETANPFIMEGIDEFDMLSVAGLIDPPVFTAHNSLHVS